jgi:hypothetical protein
MEGFWSMEARFFRVVLVGLVVFASLGTTLSLGASHPSANFVVTAPTKEFAIEVSEAAERYRESLAIQWLGKKLPNWADKCELRVRVGERMGAGGATTFVFENGQVFGWRMTIQGSRQRLLDSVLPHEIMHMILASHFRRPVPRWADEGAATSVECDEERARYRGMLLRFLRSGRGLPFSTMFVLTEYPRDVMPLYAQGFTLAEFLIGQKGRAAYLAFIEEGMETNDWPRAVKEHYGYADVGDLQNRWLAWVASDFPPLERRREDPPVMLASAGAGDSLLEKKPRPEPNLVYHVPKESPPNKLVPVRHPLANRPQPTSTDQQLTRPQPFEQMDQTILEWRR